MLRIEIANEGKVWKHKGTGDILTNTLYLGVDDSINNYEEVDEPIDEIIEPAEQIEENIIEENN